MFYPARFTLSPALTTPFPVNAFPNILAANILHNILRNPPCYFFASFLIVSLIPFISSLDSSSDLTVFITFSISSFEIINSVVTDPFFFLDSCICCWHCCV